MSLPRRRFLEGLGSSIALTGFGSSTIAATSRALTDLARRTFNYFWKTTNAANGLAPDRWPSPAPCSIAATGFALTAYPIGVENGWVSRDAARSRVLTTLRFLYGLPQSHAPEGAAGHNGFFYHFLNLQTGMRAKQCELSTVDTTWLLAGALFCSGWFDRAHVDEVEIRRLAQALYERVDWAWAIRRKPLICMGWTPELGWIEADWRGYCEAMLVYLLALGSPTHPIGKDSWTGWCATYNRHWRTLWGQEHLTFPPIFGHQYSHVWADFRGIQDSFMRSKGIDYFENSQRAAFAQKAYAQANPGGWRGYGGDIWGLTACDGPGPITANFGGRARRFTSYWARGVDATGALDDGTIAPTAAAASLPFAPSVAIPAVSALRRRYPATYGDYGFFDAFNPSIYRGDKIRTGRLDAKAGWVDSDHVGIDQGPILAMFENWRTGLVWRVMRRNPSLRRGLNRAGFSGGWL